MPQPIGYGTALFAGGAAGLERAAAAIAEGLIRRRMMEQQAAALKAQGEQTEFERQLQAKQLERQVGEGFAGRDFGVPGVESFRPGAEAAHGVPAWRAAAREVAAGEEPTFGLQSALAPIGQMPGLPPQAVPIAPPGERYEKFGAATAPGGAMAGLREPTAGDVAGTAWQARQGAIREAAVEALRPYYAPLAGTTLGKYVSPEGAALYATGSQPKPPTHVIQEFRGGTTRESTYGPRVDPRETAVINGLFRLAAQGGQVQMRKADARLRIAQIAATSFPQMSAEEQARLVDSVMSYFPGKFVTVEEIGALLKGMGINVPMGAPPRSGGRVGSRQGGGRSTTPAPADDFFTE